MIWFTADEHYDHENIIKHVRRPFSSLFDMQETIIERHNTVVAKGDIVYHLGDVTFYKQPDDFIRRLNGQHFLINGNHDPGRKEKHGPDVFVKRGDVMMVKFIGHKFFLSHYSHRVWPSSHHGTIHLYGHSHDTLPGLGRSMDIGVDANDFYPWSAEDIITCLEGINPEQVDHHAIAFAHLREPTNEPLE